MTLKDCGEASLKEVRTSAPVIHFFGLIFSMDNEPSLNEGPQWGGGSIHRFTNDIFHFHELTNDGKMEDLTISQKGFCQFTNHE